MYKLEITKFLNEVLNQFPNLAEQKKTTNYDNKNEVKFANNQYKNFPNSIKILFDFLNSDFFLNFLQRITNIQEKLIPDFELNGGGLQDARGDTLTITSQPFVEDFEGFEIKWYEGPWFRSTVENSLLVLLIGIVALGVVRPMLNKILVPTASTNSVMELYAEAESMAELATKRAAETEAVEVDEGESLDAIKAKLKPQKRAGISADMLDTANTYDDKVALIRIIVNDEPGRVANVFKGLMREDLEFMN